jgi:hypothetical protein
MIALRVLGSTRKGAGGPYVNVLATLNGIEDPNSECILIEEGPIIYPNKGPFGWAEWQGRKWVVEECYEYFSASGPLTDCSLVGKWRVKLKEYGTRCGSH